MQRRGMYGVWGLYLYIEQTMPVMRANMKNRPTRMSQR